MTYPTGPKTDYVSEALSRLISQYQDKPFLAALVTSYANRVQERENASWEVVTLRLLQNAEGAQLAAIGRIVGVAQGDLDDAAFRREIQIAILLLRSQGTPNEVEKVVFLALPDGLLFEYGDEPIATIRVTLMSLASDAVVSQVYRLAAQARQGGVRFLLDYMPTPHTLADTLTFRDIGGSYDPAKGLSDTTSPTGGFLRGVIGTS